MVAVLSGNIGGMLPSDYKRTDGAICFGGFDFEIEKDGKRLNVPFDFLGCVANIKADETIVLEEGAKTFLSGGNDQLDDCFDEQYAKMGISREDLTADVLAATTKINEFTIDCDDCDVNLNIDSITFIDDNGNEYSVEKQVIEKFNQKG